MLAYFIGAVVNLLYQENERVKLGALYLGCLIVVLANGVYLTTTDKVVAGDQVASGIAKINDGSCPFTQPVGADAQEIKSAIFQNLANLEEAERKCQPDEIKSSGSILSAISQDLRELEKRFNALSQNIPAIPNLSEKVRRHTVGVKLSCLNFSGALKAEYWQELQRRSRGYISREASRYSGAIGGDPRLLAGWFQTDYSQALEFCSKPENKVSDVAAKQLIDISEKFIYKSAELQQVLQARVDNIPRRCKDDESGANKASLMGTLFRTIAGTESALSPYTAAMVNLKLSTRPIPEWIANLAVGRVVVGAGLSIIANIGMAGVDYAKEKKEEVKNDEARKRQKAFLDMISADEQLQDEVACSFLKAQDFSLDCTFHGEIKTPLQACHEPPQWALVKNVERIQSDIDRISGLLPPDLSSGKTGVIDINENLRSEINQALDQLDRELSESVRGSGVSISTWLEEKLGQTERLNKKIADKSIVILISEEDRVGLISKEEFLRNLLTYYKEAKGKANASPKEIDEARQKLLALIQRQPINTNLSKLLSDLEFFTYNPSSTFQTLRKVESDLAARNVEYETSLSAAATLESPRGEQDKNTVNTALDLLIRNGSSILESRAFRIKRAAIDSRDAPKDEAFARLVPLIQHCSLLQMSHYFSPGTDKEATSAQHLRLRAFPPDGKEYLKTLLGKNGVFKKFNHLNDSDEYKRACSPVLCGGMRGGIGTEPFYPSNSSDLRAAATYRWTLPGVAHDLHGQEHDLYFNPATESGQRALKAAGDAQCQNTQNIDYYIEKLRQEFLNNNKPGCLCGKPWTSEAERSGCT